MNSRSEKLLVLCDIDGTVANNSHRQNLLHKFSDWDAFFAKMGSDKPIKKIINDVKILKEEGKKIIFITGRPEKYRKLTQIWLDKYVLEDYSLIMRKDNDKRNKIEVKKELFLENINKNEVLCFFENDTDLINLWKEMNLNVINVNQLHN